jgi:hypothetical protein
MIVSYFTDDRDGTTVTIDLATNTGVWSESASGKSLGVLKNDKLDTGVAVTKQMFNWLAHCWWAATDCELQQPVM